MTRNPTFDQLLDDMKELHRRKNEDYAHEGSPYSNFELAAAIAGVSVDTVFAVLLGVKMARLQVIAGKAEVNFESEVDNLRDAAVYAALRASYALDHPGSA